MKRRSAGESTDSLELLLDTICNTFGAVIFISMLVAILVNRTSTKASHDESPSDPATEAALVQTEIQQAQERLRVLSGQLRQQQLVTRRFASEESLALAGQIRQRTQDRVGLMNQKSDAVQTITEVKARSASLQRQFEQQSAQLKTAANENQSLGEQLQSQLELSGRTARIPRLRKTNKTAVVYALDDGRLYRITTAAQVVDENDCERVSSQGRELITPRKGGGLEVDGRPSSELDGRFDRLQADQYFVQIFVSRDSFAAFLPVKDVLVTRRVEYEVIITDSDQVELYLGTSQRESFVQ